MSQATESVVAVVMAGGESRRMRDSYGIRPKALVEVLGVTLLERNVMTLLKHGVTKIIVVSRADNSLVHDFVTQQLAPRFHSWSARISSRVEETPLGTIGFARLLSDREDPVLIINVDNLTDLNLADFVQRHVAADAELTIATHLEPFQIPYGELVVSGPWVREYREKPVRPIRVSSGTYVLNPKACRRIPSGKRTDVPELFCLLRSSGGRVAAYEHDANWIDVNDGASVQRATDMIRREIASFELWDGEPHQTKVDLVLREGGLLRVVHVSGSTPTLPHIVGDATCVADGRLIKVPGIDESLEYLTAYDTIEEDRLVRHLVARGRWECVKSFSK